MSRPNRDEYYLNIAKAVSVRSTCLRRQYGAVIVNHDEIVSTGYNGAPRGEPNCCDLGKCIKDELGLPHGEQYEKCVSVHAEENAIISAARKDMIGAAIYIYGTQDGKKMEVVEPCSRCTRMMINAGLKYLMVGVRGKKGVRVYGFYEGKIVGVLRGCPDATI